MHGLKILTLKGIPIRAHWSVPLGAFFFGGFRYVPVFWVAFFLLILAHEFGHAVVVRRFRHHASGILIHGFGGLCYWSGDATAIERAAIAWGGVCAQFVVLCVAVPLLFFDGWMPVDWASQIERAWIGSNLAMIALNLIPIPPLDGASAWPLFPMLFQRWRSRQRKARRRLRIVKANDSRRELSALDEREDAGDMPDVSHLVDRLSKKSASGGGSG